MIVQVVYLDVQANRLDDFLTEASANARASLLEAGVTRFDLLQQADDPLKFMLYEVYRNQTDLDAHRLTPHFKRWQEMGLPTLSGERVRRMYQLLETGS
ncbi:MAG: putative quinol monooxygenase [Chloroflexi bacterium]|nr:putative quinol monooxygenase [Chloroflexota bacterium]